MKHLPLAGVMLSAGLSCAGEPVQALMTACQGLAKHSSDLKLSAPEFIVADQTTQREQGWKTVHQIVATVGDNPSPTVAGVYKAKGQRCYFQVSPDLRTIAVTKTACMALCKAKPFEEIRIGGRPYVGYFGADGSEKLMR